MLTPIHQGNVSAERAGAPATGSWHFRPERNPTERTKILLVQDSGRPFGYEIADLEGAGLCAAVDIEIFTVEDLFLSSGFLTDDVTPGLGYSYNERFQKYDYRCGSFTELDAASREAARQVQQAFPYWTVTKSCSTELATHAVVKKAAQWRPDLVVIGAAGLVWCERGKLRTLTHKLVSEARCSVRLVRSSRAADPKPGRIMIGFDGSRHSEAALEAVRQRNWSGGSAAYLVSCFELPVTDELGWARRYFEADRRHLAERVNEAKLELEQLGFRVHTILETGDAAETLIDKAKQLEVQSIFLGTRGLGVIETWFSGSVAATVAARADCSVEVTCADIQPRVDAIPHPLAA